MGLRRRIGNGEGKVWIGYFHVWTEDHTGRRIRTKREKKLGPGTMPKHEAQLKLAEYIEEYTGKLIHHGTAGQTIAVSPLFFSFLRSITLQ